MREPKINIYNQDCLIALKAMPDNAYELAICDPPYGIGIGERVGGEKLARVKQYKDKTWDNSIPDKRYFEELRRVSKNQIIWGGNYFIENLNNTPCFIVWDKNNTGNFADAELAWTSFKTAVRIFKYTWNGMLQENMKDKEIRIHQTQKPVALYKWLLKNYAKEGDKILDTHSGSASLAIACWDMEYDLDAFELDKDYYEASIKRLELHKKQQRLF